MRTHVVITHVFIQRALLALTLASTWSCTAQVDPNDPALDDGQPYDDDSIAVDERRVASTTQALATYYPINTLGRFTLNSASGHPCYLEFQYGNIWATAYGKARITGGECPLVIIALTSHDGTNWHSTQVGFNTRGAWVDATLPWSNVVGVRYSVIWHGHEYFREFTPFPPQ